MKYLFVFMFLLSSFWPFQVAAQDTAYAIERSEVFNFKSESLDRSYDIYVKLPRSYSSSPEKHYPLILLSDGGYSFPLVSSISRQMSGSRKIEEPIIIGMSYSKEEPWQMSRTRDYTPTHSPNEENYHSREAREVSGGANAYANFLTTELIPFLSATYRVDPQKKVFAGHSFGGLLGGYLIKSHPDAFNYYIISDPSFWYHSGSIFDIEATQPTEQAIKPEILIVSTHQHQEEKGPLKMEENAQRFERQLQANPSFYGGVKIEIIEGEIHETLFPIAVSHGMLLFLGK